MSILSCCPFGTGYRHPAHLERERQRGLRAGLARAPSGQWLGITEQEVNLDARVVIAIETCRREIDVGAQEACGAVRTGLDHQDDTHVALARHLVDHLGVADNSRLAGRHPLKARPVRPMHLAVVWLWTARAGTWRTILAIAEVGIMAPLATLMERDGPAPLEELLCAVIAIGDDVASWVQGIRLDDTSHVVQIDIHAGRLRVSGGAYRWCLCNPEDVGAVVRDLEPAQR